VARTRRKEYVSMHLMIPLKNTMIGVSASASHLQSSGERYMERHSSAGLIGGLGAYFTSLSGLSVQPDHTQGR